MQRDKSVLEIASLSFKHKQESVLQNINLSIGERDFLAIIGPNGGGKSTLLKLILGIYKTQSGIIKTLHNKIAYVPQNTNININFPIKAIDVLMLGNPTNKSKTDALEILEKVGMKEYAENKIGSLSGGQRQRIMIARALFSNPEIILLDEPTSNIDPEGQKQIYNLLKKLNEQITVVVVSHDLSIILKYANKVAYINKTLTFHDLRDMKKNLNIFSEHICEVELLKLMQRCTC